LFDITAPETSTVDPHLAAAFSRPLPLSPGPQGKTTLCIHRLEGWIIQPRNTQPNLNKDQGCSDSNGQRRDIGKPTLHRRHDAGTSKIRSDVASKRKSNNREWLRR